MNSLLINELEELLSHQHSRPVVLIGVGNSLKSDDGAGSALARRLIGRGMKNVIDAGVSPENYAERMLLERPALLIFLDAAEFGAPPGEARLFKIGEIDGGARSTHDASLALLAGYCRNRHPCEVRVIGIQAATMEMGLSLSPAVGKVVEELELFLWRHLV